MSNTDMWANILVGIAVCTAIFWAASGIQDWRDSDKRAPAAQMIRTCSGTVQMMSTVSDGVRITTVVCTEGNATSGKQT